MARPRTIKCPRCGSPQTVIVKTTHDTPGLQFSYGMCRHCLSRLKVESTVTCIDKAPIENNGGDV